MNLKILFSIPVIILFVSRDPATDRCLSRSLQIALNLECLYPHSKQLFPPGTEDLITNFDDKFLRSVATALAPLLLSRI